MTQEEALEIIKNAKPIEPIELHRPQTPIINLATAKEKTFEEKQRDLKRLQEFFDKKKKLNKIINKVRYGSTR